MKLSPCGTALKDPYKSLPSLWDDIVKKSFNHKPFAHPSLFDWYSTGYIINTALLRSQLLPYWNDSLLPFPLEVDGQFSNTIGVILHTLADTSAGMATHFKTFDGAAPDALYEHLTDILVNWINVCIAKMSSPSALRVQDPDQNLILIIVRCVAFLYNVNSSSVLLESHTLYQRVVSVLGA
jgi:hypothetical protein